MKIKHWNQNIYFLSDTHFFHNAVIKYNAQKFQDIKEHDEALIENWNKRIGPEDTVYHLGDFVIGNLKETEDILSRLNGKITFCQGNHDERLFKVCKKFQIKIYDLIELRIRDKDADREVQAISCCHYPIAEWNKSHYGSWMLHGHCHGDCEFTNNNNSVYKILDVGVDCHNYSPISYNEVKEIMKTRISLAHHGRVKDER